MVQNKISALSWNKTVCSLSAVYRLNKLIALKEKFAIYAVRSGRINVAGITEDNIRYLCESTVKVL